MKVTILGCGTSTGVPMPACNCQVCTSNDPKNSRLRASVLVQTDCGQNILIDCSPDFRQQALRAGLMRIDAILFTHAHADHILGLDDVRCFNFIQQQAIPCYALAQTQSRIEKMFDYIFGPDPNYEGGGLAKLSFHNFEVGDILQIGSQQIQTFRLIHGKLCVAGFRIGNFAYATDCHLIPEESFRYLDQLDLLIIDGLRHQPHPTHFTIEDAVAMAKKIKAKQTLLTHYTHNIDYNQLNPTLPQGVALAYDELEIEV